MHKAFPLSGESSHWQYMFPLPVEGVPTARRMEIPLPGVCTAMMKKLPVKEKNWVLIRSKAKEKSSKALMAIDGVKWDWSYMDNEEDHALEEKDVVDGKLARLLKSSKILKISLRVR
nr:hypothetical protein [Tanacetum cinerariifolium]